MKIRQTKGFTAIELLIALVIVMGGIAASMTLQGLFMQTASDAKNRTQAISLAQQKINDLKSFTEITKPFEADGETEIDWSADPEQVMAYEYIANNAGGIIASGVQNLASNTTYTMTWSSQDNWYTGVDAGSASTIEDPGSGQMADFKNITVTVVWNDQADEVQIVNLDSYISITPSNGTAKVIGDNGGEAGGANGPEVIHNPGLAPEVLPIFCTAGGDCVETSRPLPELVQTGQRKNTIVTFEAVTYDDEGGNVAISQEESLTLSCNCTFDDSGSGNTPAHRLWDETNSKSYNKKGKSITKPSALQVDNDGEAEGFCTSCCRDHHDGGGDDQKIFYNSAGSSGDDHKHYDSAGDEVETGAYIESCRFKRIDGVWRVFQDWNLKTLTILPRDSLAGDALQTAYIDYVTDCVQKEAIAVGAGVALSKPNPSDLRTPVELAIGSSRQLQSRGVYLDNVYSEDENNEGSISSNYITYITNNIGNSDYLNQIPFTELNLTLLSEWTSSDPNFFTVTNEPIDTIPDEINDYYGVFSRGLLHGVSVGTEKFVTSEIETGNNGLTNTTNELDTSTSEDSVVVNIVASGGDVNLNGTYSITGSPLGNGEQ